MTRPLVTAEARPFWAGLAEHRLVLPWCPTCSRYLWPPPVRCARCLTTDLEQRAVESSGTIRSRAVVRRPLVPGYPPPYVVARVELSVQPGLFIEAAVRGLDPEAVEPGLRVEAEFVDHRTDGGDGFTVLAFRVSHS